MFYFNWKFRLNSFKPLYSSSELKDKLHMKEDEFSTLCSELQVIKDTTLGKCGKKNNNYIYIHRP